MAPGCSNGRGQAAPGNVRLEYLGPGMLADVTLTHSVPPSQAMLQTMYTLSWKRYSIMAMASFSSTVCPKQKLFHKWMRSTTTTLRCCRGFQIPQISIQSSIYGMCWTCAVTGGFTSLINSFFFLPVIRRL